MSTTPAPSPSERATSSAELLARGVHRATLPTGAVVYMRFPPLGVLIQSGHVPLELRELAKAEYASPGGAAGAVGQAIAGRDATDPAEWDAITLEVDKLRRFLTWLVAEHTLVEPKLSLAEVESGDLDERDVDMLIDFALRRTDRDAMGVRLGVMSLEDAAVFREEHGCAHGCEGCARGQARLSSPRVALV